MNDMSQPKVNEYEDEDLTDARLDLSLAYQSLIAAYWLTGADREHHKNEAIEHLRQSVAALGYRLTPLDALIAAEITTAVAAPVTCGND